MTDQEKLAYAKENYPIGTKYDPVLASGRTKNSVTEVVRAVNMYHNTGNIDCGVGYIYFRESDLWAPIISKVTNEEYVLI